jgi:hypothetical protein
MGWARSNLPVVGRRRGGDEHASNASVEFATDSGRARSASRVLVDAATRTFWSRGAADPVTLAELIRGGQHIRAFTLLAPDCTDVTPSRA